MYVGPIVKHSLSLNFVERCPKKIPKYHISCKSVQWKPRCSLGTDRQDEASSRFPQFCDSSCLKDKLPLTLTALSKACTCLLAARKLRAKTNTDVCLRLVACVCVLCLRWGKIYDRPMSCLHQMSIA